MKLALIGVGQAGGKIADTFFARDRAVGGPAIVEHVVAINTSESDHSGLAHLPSEARLLIGESEVRGHGVGGDNELGAQIAEKALDEIHSAFQDISMHKIDAFLIVAGLGGGTGSGGAPVIAAHLHELYQEPIYGLGILPSADEGGIYTLNAARSLPTLADRVDNLILFDNESWRSVGESVDAGYQTLNEELVKQVELIFRAGELAEGQEVAESVVDTSEIINTLAGGGVSTVGYAEDGSIEPATASQGLLSRFRSEPDPIEDAATAVSRITGLIRRATLGRLTIDAEVGTTERGLIVVAGPSEYLNRKGIESGRKWLEEETGSMHIRGGDYPWTEHRVAVSVLLSGIAEIPRIDSLHRQAIEANRNLETVREEHSKALDELDSEQLEKLF